MKDIRQLAAEAFSKARQKHLDAGRSVVEGIKDTLYEVFPDGTKKFIKELPKGIKVKKGAKIKLC